MEKDNTLEIHLIMVVSYTFLALFMILEIIMLKWELWTIPLFLCGVVAIWHIHVRQRMPENTRFLIYSVLTLVMLFFFGVHEEQFYEMPVLILFCFGLFALTDYEYVFLPGCLVYFVQLIWHIVVTGTVGMTMSAEEWATCRAARRSEITRSSGEEKAKRSI